MRIKLDNLFSKRLVINANGQAHSNDPKKEKSDTQMWRNVIAYWLLGLTTEFGYVLIISAAHDILQSFSSNSNHDDNARIETADTVANMRKSVCDAPSTGVLLLADIVPSMLMNIMCPFLPLVKNFRMFLVIILNVSSFLIISSTGADYLAIIGVIFTSLALGIGEVTLLSYSYKFNKRVITAWSSGTGSAGPVGSLLYAGITLIGISPRDTVRIMLIIPAIQATTFWILLRSPSQSIDDNDNGGVKNIAVIELNNNITENADIEVKLHGVKAKLKFIPKLAGFIAPLVIVFIFEYICVSGLFEMIHVQDKWLPPSSQYRWFLVMYQMGVFSSRSLGALFKPRRAWWTTILQALNASGFIYMTSSMNMPSAWIIFILVFGVGCVGGFCYVQTFHRLVKELPVSQHKFSLGMMTIAESFGIAVGGLSAIPIRSIICGKSMI